MRIFVPAEPAEERIAYAVVGGRCGAGWIFVQHRDRTSWELPGGHREAGESPEETAERELWEESGARARALERVCCYGVEDEDGRTSYGALFLARIEELGELPTAFEMKERRIAPEPPGEWTYPRIQPVLMGYLERHWRAKRAGGAGEA